MFRVATGLAVGGIMLAAMSSLHPLYTEVDCSGGGRWCPRTPEMERPGEKLMTYRERESRKGSPAPGSLRAAYDKKAALAAAKADIKGANGEWQAYGRGPLLDSGLIQNQLDSAAGTPVPETYLQTHAGRVDNFAYDPVNKRLFAAPGTGGIWMSQARDGDVKTIGDYWISIGDQLPTQANGGVIYTPVGGGEGTVISAGGDSVMSTGAYAGLGAYWSNDLGITWTRSNGYPDEALVFNTEADPGNPNIVYIASSLGLYRSEDAGRNFSNVRLPISNAGVDCAGDIDRSTPCNLAVVVSDVVVQAPGGTGGLECSSRGCPVLAAVGWRSGRQFYPGTEVEQAPANGLYRSDTGVPGSFTRLEPAAIDPATEMGFTPAERIGRVEMGAASGVSQDHGYVYALVQDAELLNGAAFELDAPLNLIGAPPVAFGFLSGVFVSPDFGTTWMRMATTQELAPFTPFTGLGVVPGVQAWYDQWILPDPTRAVAAAGIPTRVAFGLEEIWQSRLPHVPQNGIAQAGPADFDVLGRYWSMLGVDQTTHPDQHAAIFIPTGPLPGGDGGVCLFVGNDGGVHRQCVTAGGEFNSAVWGPGNNAGFYTLLPYGLGVAKDGTVYFGLQDNGSGHIDPDTRESFGDFGGDGFFGEVDPDNSDIGYLETQNGGLRRTTNRGGTFTTIAPPYSRPNFANWFSMDPLDGNHMITTANEIYETTEATTVTAGTWEMVYSVGSHTVTAGETETEVIHTATVADVHGPAIYAGWCGDCGVTKNDTAFQRGLATNIGGAEPPSPGSYAGWHDASMRGLPNRLITAVEIDPDDPNTVYIGLGGYMADLRGPNTFGEDSTGADVEAGNLFKSTDAGESFVSIQGDLPSMPVSTILARNGQLLVGTDFGAFISSDLQGSEWTTLGNGLPNVPVTMFKLQPGNPNMLFASTFGRHVWTYEFPPEAQIARADVSRFGGALPLLSALWLLLAAAGRFGRHLWRRD